MKLFVPGRICLFGEHSDWAGTYRRFNTNIEKGYALITGTNQGIYAEVEPHPTSLVLTSTAPDGTRVGPYEIPMEAQTLFEEAQSGFELCRGRCLPDSDALPRTRAGDRQLQNRPAYQEGAVVQRGDLRADRARLQPRLRPQDDDARRNGDGLPGRDHHAVALRAHGPGLRLWRPPDPDDIRRRPAGRPDPVGGSCIS